MSPILKSALVLSSVFFLGAVTGGGVTKYYSPRRVNNLFEGSPLVVRQRAFVRALDEEVSLDDRQLAEVRRIVGSHEPEMREIRRALRPRVHGLRARVLDEIRAVMRPDQLSSYQRFVERQESHSRALGDGPPPGRFDGTRPPPPLQ